MLKSRILPFSILISFGIGIYFYVNKVELKAANLTRSPASIATPIPATFQIPMETDKTLEACDDIYRFVCQKSGDTVDPTGVVRPDIEGERQALAIFREIIRTHQDWNKEQISEELVRQIFDNKRRTKIESAFQWVRHTLSQFIDRQSNSVFRPGEKELIKSRILSTQLDLPFPASNYSDEPDLLTRNEVYYERLQDGQMRLRVGGAFVLIAKSWFNLVFTLAHELAHAVDPCEIAAAGLDFSAYNQLTSCFFETGLIPVDHQNSKCEKNEQLSETFADWIAVQMTLIAIDSFSKQLEKSPPPHLLLSRYPSSETTSGLSKTVIRNQVLSAARNSVRDLCEQDSGPDETELVDEIESHPPPKTRINLIFGPPIQNYLGCKSAQISSTYCNFNFSPKKSHL